jgi:hypothetical protein
MPIVGLALPGGDWRSAQLSLGGSAAIKYGDLFGRAVDFVIVALVVFIIVKALLPPAPATKTCPEYQETIPAAAALAPRRWPSFPPSPLVCKMRSCGEVPRGSWYSSGCLQSLRPWPAPSRSPASHGRNICWP